jgi:hypothetical protein
MPQILATWEAEIRRIAVGGQLRQIVLETPPISKITRPKWTEGVTHVVECLFCKFWAFSSNPSPTKKKRTTKIWSSCPYYGLDIFRIVKLVLKIFFENLYLILSLTWEFCIYHTNLISIYTILSSAYKTILETLVHRRSWTFQLTLLLFHNTLFRTSLGLNGLKVAADSIVTTLPWGMSPFSWLTCLTIVSAVLVFFHNSPTFSETTQDFPVCSHLLQRTWSPPNHLLFCFHIGTKRGFWRWRLSSIPHGSWICWDVSKLANLICPALSWPAWGGLLLRTHQSGGKNLVRCPRMTTGDIWANKGKEEIWRHFLKEKWVNWRF